jgi:hypothetical protein
MRIKKQNSHVNSLQYGERYYRTGKTPGKETGTQGLPGLSQFETIQNYYCSFDYFDPADSKPETITCFASELASLIIEIISLNRILLTKKRTFPESFYQRVIIKINNEQLFKEIDDTELLLIYTDQCLSMLRMNGIITINDRTVVIAEKEISKNKLYFRLIHTFWDIIPWEEIFSSDTEAAVALHKNRYILRDIVLKAGRAKQLDRILNEFFNMTGFSFSGDMMMTSFIDFYVFTWMKHFGLITYKAGPMYAPVTVEVTPIGTKILKSL